MILHIINKSPHQHATLNDALPFINASDAVMLIDDGVYCASTLSSATALLNTKAAIFALTDDIETRGITGNAAIAIVNMEKFVEIAFNADKTISWY
jgi:sulfur relay protein TusB/DsrH